MVMHFHVRHFSIWKYQPAMRILHVFSANLFTGSVSYALELAQWQHQQGHEVYLASDALPQDISLPYVQVPIHDRRYLQRYKNVRVIQQLVKKHRIQVVHAHSRAASWVANWALKGLRVAQVSTVHGRQHIHFSSRHTDVFGQRIIVVSEALKEHLVQDLNKEARKISVIPNGISYPAHRETKGTASSLNISLIGRLSGPKGARAAAMLAYVFPELLERFDQLHITIVGGSEGAIPNQGNQHAATLSARFPNRFRMTGFVTDVGPYIRQSDLVIGAGRVALLTLLERRPLYAIGESACRGFVYRHNVADAAKDNFGDMGCMDERSCSPERVLQDLGQWCSDLPTRSKVVDDVDELFDWANSRFNWNHIGARIMEAYKAAIMECLHPGYIPVLMFHKVPDGRINTPHRIFVTKEHFTRHLKLIRLRGLTPITFTDYADFAEGKRDAHEFPAKPIVLTFDDGYEDNYKNLLPLMQQYGYRGVLFLLGDFTHTHNFWDGPDEAKHGALMNRQQAAAFVQAGWEIGAHTLSHPRLPELSTKEAIAEIDGSRKALESLLGISVHTFAYPYGLLTEEMKAITESLGFKFAVATDTGGMHWEDDRYQIFRINMFPEDGYFALWKKTSAWYRRYYFRKRGK